MIINKNIKHLFLSEKKEKFTKKLNYLTFYNFYNLYNLNILKISDLISFLFSATLTISGKPNNVILYYGMDVHNNAD